MAAGVIRLAETEQHARLKRLAFLWAQTHGFLACAMEVILPRCRYRADVAAYRSVPKQIGSTAVFECKRTLCDLRRDNCYSELARRRVEAICSRRQVLEERLREHYPNLHNGDSLFPEFDCENFIAIGHRGYARLTRELRVLQNRLYDCTKFEKLIRYGCANVFFIVLPKHLFRDSEVPVGWGALIESDGALTLARRPIWHNAMAENRLDVLQRIAVAATRKVNQQLPIERTRSQ
ncbi:MAG TPA: hypothetical protein VFQ78_07640 [Candidatus Udaeobacter sp.]|jgi:hypothetical protein|nr:hypothetical protein [Candidatus Udaeobacter sp.]